MFFKTAGKKIKQEAEEFFKKMNFSGEVEVKEKEKDSFYLNLKSDDPQILIGKSGQTLSDIQYLLRRILNKKDKSLITGEGEERNIYLEVDINNYRQKKKEYLKELAHNVADEVALLKKEKVLEPMPAYERRVIHIELSSRGDVETESLGQEPERRVVVKPASQ